VGTTVRVVGGSLIVAVTVAGGFRLWIPVPVLIQLPRTANPSSRSGRYMRGVDTDRTMQHDDSDDLNNSFFLLHHPSRRVVGGYPSAYYTSSYAATAGGQPSRYACTMYMYVYPRGPSPGWCQIMYSARSRHANNTQREGVRPPARSPEWSSDWSTHRAVAGVAATP
jgi:hypothetical protein